MFSARRLIASRDTRQPWDIGGARLTHTFSLASQGGLPTGLAFRPDGTQFFVVDPSDDVVREYALSSAWDLSTASYTRQLSTVAQDGEAFSLAFRTDGSRMYVGGASNNRIYEYSLSTAWNISTATYTRYGAVATDPRGMGFSASGSKVFVAMYTSPTTTADYIRQYDLSTPWDVSTISSTGDLANRSADDVVYGVALADGGTRLYISEAASAEIEQYSLATADTISSASFLRSVSVGGVPTGLAISPDGKTMIVLNTVNDDSSIRQYSLAT